MRRILTTLVLASALFALGAVSVIGTAPDADAADQSIDLTAEVAGGDCAPCHGVFDATDVPGLVFKHTDHLLVECTACHVKTPHEAGQTYRPTMRTCFTCHGLLHGPQGLLAPSECTACHTAAWELRPQSHGEDWAQMPHVAAVELTGENPCMLCHVAEDCDTCHAQLAPEAEPVQTYYLRTLPAPVERPAVEIDVGAPTSMGQCTFCHEMIDQPAGSPILTFGHGEHLKRDYECTACHEAFPHQPDGTVRPAMISCYRCHTLDHGVQGEVASLGCYDCHPESFELAPADHNVAFMSDEHSEQAYEGIEQCAMCHSPRLCAACHVGGATMRNGVVSQPVIPADHQTPNWQPDHGARFLGQEGACSICHDNSTCVECHITSMPHPTNWVTLHASGNGFVVQDDCGVCHADRSYCQECHHASVASVELLRENCVECHDEMRTSEPTTIKNIGLAEHAVHFDVQERVGRNYVCADCHVGFTRARVMQPSVTTQAHDLRLCYDCHGSLGPDNLLIAPWPGKELCRRCHTDLNI